MNTTSSGFVALREIQPDGHDALIANPERYWFPWIEPYQYQNEPVAYVASHPDVDGCLAQEHTEEQARAGWYANLKEWLAAKIEMGAPIPPPSIRRFNATIHIPETRTK